MLLAPRCNHNKNALIDQCDGLYLHFNSLTVQILHVVNDKRAKRWLLLTISFIFNTSIESMAYFYNAFFPILRAFFVSRLFDYF